ncbi:MAG: hypothetical protein K2F87_02540 [Muribaculaceae bacterium]|nr:hypothetical protein [Muribaculaceae bacterium]
MYGCLFQHIRRLRLLTLAMPLFTALTASAAPTDFETAGHPTGACADRGRAEEYLTGLPLGRVEGIWEYPADETAVMVIADPMRKGAYGIFLVETTDCRLTPGMLLGRLEESPNSEKFKISLCSRLAGGLPTGWQEGLASLSQTGDALLIEMPKLKLSLNPSMVLPVLWNRLRLNLRVKHTDPLDRLPEGWIRVFPTADGNSADLSHPRYL